MMRRAPALGLAALAALAGCGERQTGYVEVRVVPSSFQSYALLLDSKPLRPTRGTAVVKRGVGTARLEFERRKDERLPLCEVAVRKDRVTTVTVSPQGLGLRCAVETV